MDEHQQKPPQTINTINTTVRYLTISNLLIAVIRIPEMNYRVILDSAITGCLTMLLVCYLKLLYRRISAEEGMN